MPTVRVLSPAIAKSHIRMLDGTSYTQSPGTALDVPDHHADQLEASGWLVLGQSGATPARPTSRTPGRWVAQAGDHFYDQTLGALLVFDGLLWRNPSTGAAA